MAALRPFAMVDPRYGGPSLWRTTIVWCPYKQGDIKELEKIQKRATKLVINLKKLPYKDRLMHLKLPTLKYRRLHEDMIEVLF